MGATTGCGRVAWSDAWITIHAGKRARQRGISEAVLALVTDQADRETPVGRHCVALTLSRKRQERLCRQGADPLAVERATGVAVVVGAAGRIVTVLHLSGRRSRPYRHRFVARRGACDYEGQFHG